MMNEPIKFTEFLNKSSHLITELVQNKIYKDIKQLQSRSSIQLPLPFEFSDEVFLSKKDQAEHLLRSLNFMKLGYKFECYLKKQTQYDESDHEEIIDFEDFEDLFMNVLEEYFPRGEDNKIPYARLNNAFSSWRELYINDYVNNHLDAEVKKEMNQDTKERMEVEVIRSVRKRLMIDSEEDENFGTFDDFVKKNFGATHFFDLIDYYNFVPDERFEFNDENNLIPKNDSFDHIKDLAEFLQHQLHTPVKVFGTYHAFEKDYENHWYVEPDSSLDKSIPERDYFPVEVVTKIYPAYQYKLLFDQFHKILEKGNYDPRTNEATGLHFSVSFESKEKNTSINLLKLVVLGQDSFWAKRVGREFNTYCQSQLRNVKQAIPNLVAKILKDKKENNLTSNVPLTIDDLREKPEFIRALTNQIQVNQKYTAMNFLRYNKGEGFIEFRLAGNDYFGSDREANLRMVEWFLYILIASSTFTLWEEEYLGWVANECNKAFMNLRKD